MICLCFFDLFAVCVLCVLIGLMGGFWLSDIANVHHQEEAR